jgi:aspartate-semialdehyde dehydrogenase
LWWPSAQAFGLESVRVATYQSVSGAGRDGIDELIDQTRAHLDGEDLPPPNTFPHIMSFNAIPQIGSFDEDGYCSEENKIALETKKILGLPDLPVSPFTVRVPTLNVHSEAVWVTLQKDISREEFIEVLKTAPGLLVDESPAVYPHKWKAHDSNLVHVGKIRKDKAFPRSWQFWVVADNLRKGAAYNGFQIAQHIF